MLSAALAVGGRRSAGDVRHKDASAVKVELEDDPPVADAAPAGVGKAVKADGVTAEGIDGQTVELGEESVALVPGCAPDAFLGA